MKIKPGVRVLGLRPEILLALVVAESIYRKHGAELVLTSVVEGSHSAGSLHYRGDAIALRTKGVGAAHVIFAELRATLTGDYDVLFENAGGVNEHIHLEYQPKLPL